MKNSCEEIRTIFSVGLWKEYSLGHKLVPKMKGLLEQFFFLTFIYFYIFIFGCVGSSFLCEGFL